MREIYEKTGYPCIFTSAIQGKNIDEVKALLKGKTTAIAGPSGVGKSSIINILQPEAKMETGDISQKIERGKHTTRHSELAMFYEYRVSKEYVQPELFFVVAISHKCSLLLQGMRTSHGLSIILLNTVIS